MTKLTSDGARRLFAEIVALEGLLESDRDWNDDPDWLLLPVTKRHTAFKRHTTLSAYDRIREPTVDDATKAAGEIGVQLRRFYEMLAEWTAGGRRPQVLVPHRALAEQRKTRLGDIAVANRVRSIIARYLKDNPTASPGAVVRHVHVTWGSAGGLPSDVTIRNFHDQALVDLRHTPGTLSVKVMDGEEERSIGSSRLGEVLVIDHTAPAHVVLDEKGTPVPTLTLAIDLWSGALVSVEVTDDYPSPTAVAEAIADGVFRLGLDDVPSQAKPTIVMATTFEPGWDVLRANLQKDGFKVIERRDRRLHHGSFAKPLIGPKLAGMQLQPQLASKRQSRPAMVDASKTAIITRHDLELMIERAVTRRIRELAPDLPERHVIRPGQPKKLKRMRAVDPTRRKVREWLTAVVVETLGNGILKRDPHLEKEADGSWRVTVSVSPEADQTRAWLDLARAAIGLDDDEGVEVRFDLVSNDRGPNPGRA
ncbi:hypothetical protein QH494_12740 [Sphingomonas sp. AR_OL41]|uniref:hypothetical protein n=1 Tax=Sphingomonas sp. AR_OL41 TaxID=3042729 RepID=UPI00247FCA2B|nr:hypothetical protein [Sphingomonas sp. AR_OL41]MDH7973047.1 hypothetical protein [Sphingomonas sp. AR_OL41]